MKNKKRSYIENEHIAFAFNEDNEEIHISNADSGLKGYWCIGCGGEMKAWKGKIMPHLFSHYTKAGEVERKCVFSNEQYRHKIAKEILQRIKEVRVPNLYQKLPKGVSGRRGKISSEKIVYADKVLIEHQFYEDEDGKIRWGRNIDFEKSENKNKYFLIQPDVTFLNKEGKPILFIEIEATNKIDDEKKARIRMIGVDTIRISVPKSSREGIQECFFITSHTKWVYNYEQETTPYKRISKGDAETLQAVDSGEGGVFEGDISFSCRRKEIKGLIQRLKKHLGSRDYQTTLEKLRETELRIERNTENYRIRLQELQRKHRERIKGELQESFEESASTVEQAGRRTEKETLREFDNKEKPLGEEEKRFEGEKEKFEQYYQKVETRYRNLESTYRKAQREYKELQRAFEPECQNEIEEIERRIETIGGRTRDFEQEKKEVGRLQESWRGYIIGEKKRIEKLTIGEESAIKEIGEGRKGLAEKYGGIEKGIRSEFTEKERKIEEEFGKERERLEERFDKLREQSNLAVDRQNVEGKERIHLLLKEFIERREIATSSLETRARIKNIRKFGDEVESGSYKCWIR